MALSKAEIISFLSLAITITFLVLYIVNVVQQKKLKEQNEIIISKLG